MNYTEDQRLVYYCMDEETQALQDRIQSGEAFRGRKAVTLRALKALNEGRCFLPSKRIPLETGHFIPAYTEVKAKAMGSLELVADYWDCQI